MALLGFWPPLAHLVIVAACVATAWWRFETAPRAPSGSVAPESPAAAEPSTATEEAETDPNDWSGYVETVAARALFSPGRLSTSDMGVTEVPAPTPAAPDPASAVPLPPLRMVGYFDQGGRRSAILETLDDGQSHVVREGDEIAGGLVREISSGAVVVESAGQQVTVELYPE